MSTVQAVIDRLYRTYLTPPDAQYAQVQLGQAADATQTAYQLGSFTISEDENLLRQGSLIELGQELDRVTAYDSVTKVVTVQRGQYGTPVSAHEVPTLINLNPTYPLSSVFEAVRDNIIQLYPKLFTVKSVALASVSGNVFPIGDLLIAEVVQVWKDQAMTELDFDAKSVEFHPQAAGPAIVTGVNLGSIWVRYRSRMGVATSLDDTLADLGVEDVWTPVIMAGAAADLMAGRDITASQTQWVGSVLEAENIQVGTRTSVAVGLARYRELLIDRFSNEMRGSDSNRIKVHQSDPLRQVG